MPDVTIGEMYLELIIGEIGAALIGPETDSAITGKLAWAIGRMIAAAELDTPDAVPAWGRLWYHCSRGHVTAVDGDPTVAIKAQDLPQCPYCGEQLDIDDLHIDTHWVLGLVSESRSSHWVDDAISTFSPKGRG